MTHGLIRVELGGKWAICAQWSSQTGERLEGGEGGGWEGPAGGGWGGAGGVLQEGGWRPGEGVSSGVECRGKNLSRMECSE